MIDGSAAELAGTRKGSITRGKLADLVILSHGIFAVQPRQILEARPVLTKAGGRIVFESGDPRPRTVQPPGH